MSRLLLSTQATTCQAALPSATGILLTSLLGFTFQFWLSHRGLLSPSATVFLRDSRSGEGDERISFTERLWRPRYVPDVVTEAQDVEKVTDEGPARMDMAGQ